MRVLNGFNSHSMNSEHTESTRSSSKKAPRKSGKKATRETIRAPRRENLSPQEIRAKLAEGLSKSKAKRLAEIKRNTRQSSSFMSELSPHEKEAQRQTMLALKAKNELKAKELAADKSNPNSPDYVMNADVQKNDPNDEMTQSKLKDILKTGTFKFSEKEKKALADILN